jgi:hypothetical protein
MELLGISSTSLMDKSLKISKYQLLICIISRSLVSFGCILSWVASAVRACGTHGAFGGMRAMGAADKRPHR